MSPDDRRAVSAELQAYLERIPSAVRRRDAERMLELMGRVTGEAPGVGRGMVGYGTYHYRYASGREGDAPAAAFAARREAIVVYLGDGLGAHEDALQRLGSHRTGVGCLYLRNLDDVDLDVLESMVASSYARLTRGTFSSRGRQGADETGS
jgi:hypothetical protein